MHPLRTSRHLLQLVQKSALPEVSGRSWPSLARSTSPGACPNALRPCGLHASSSFGPVGLAEQEGPLRSPLPNQCRNSPRSGLRTQTPRCRNRLLQRPAHLDSKTRTSPACTLCGAGRWAVRQWHTLDYTTLRLLSSRQGARRNLSRQVPRSAPARLSGRQAQLSWRPEAPCSTENLCCVAETTVPKGLGGLLKTSLRRPRACAPLSGPLHSSRSHLQPPPGLVCQRPRHVSLARFRPQHRPKINDPISR